MPTRTALFALLFAPAFALAQGPDDITWDSFAEPPPEPEPLLTTSVTGYLDTRTTLTGIDTGGLVPTNDLPGLANVTEGNFQLRLRWADKALAYADTSFFWQKGGFFYTAGPNGERERIDGHDVPALRPAVVLSELYASVDFHENLRLTLGRQRVVWGSGFAQNPMDLLNPPKDPTDPTMQRAGTWMARLDAPFARWTFTLVGAAKVLREYGGLPAALLYHPDHPIAQAVDDPSLDDRDTAPHFTSAARLYALVADTDLNLVWFFSNLHNDAFENKHRVGVSASRVFGALELHVESLFQLGSDRLYVNPDCIDDGQAFLACVTTGTAPAERARLDDRTFNARALAGGRWMFDNSAIFSFEYFFNGDGYDRDGFRDYLQLVDTALDVARALPPGTRVPDVSFFGSRQPPGTPQKFTFEPLRRHYLFLSYQQPQIRDDFTVFVMLLLDAEDLSGQFAPQVTWSVRQWLNLSAGVFVSLPGIESLGVDVNGTRYTEYGLIPMRWRGYVSARAFY